jgi:hypothetical protein
VGNAMDIVAENDAADLIAINGRTFRTLFEIRVRPTFTFGRSKLLNGIARTTRRRIGCDFFIVKGR